MKMKRGKKKRRKSRVSTMPVTRILSFQNIAYHHGPTRVTNNGRHENHGHGGSTYFLQRNIQQI